MVKRTHKLSSLVARAVLLAFAFAPAAARAEQLPIRRYTVADGLAHDQVQRIVRDSRGFLWFCTLDGLSRFDGHRFHNYNKRDGLPHPTVNDLVESRRDGSYWVATNGGGVARFDPAEDARRVAAARDGEAVAGPDAVGARAVFKTYRVGDDAQANIVDVLLEDRDGNIWAGTQGGLFRLGADDIAGGKFERVPLGVPAYAERVMEVGALAEDAEGNLWAGTIRGLVRRFPDGRTTYHPVQAAQGTDYVNALLTDKAGRLWVAHQSGLYVVNAVPSASIAGGAIVPARASPDASPPGAVGGSFRLPEAPGETRRYTTAEGLAANYAVALGQLSDGGVWVGTRGGVSVFEGGRLRTYAAAHGLGGRVNAVAEDRDGNVWVGTQASGASKIARGGFVSYTEGEGLGSPEVVSMFECPNGVLCVVTTKWTVNWFDGEKFSHARLNLPAHVLESSSGRWQIIRDRAGEWWAATGEGLYRFPAVERLEDLARVPPKARYTTREGLADDNISRLFEDSRGDVWIGSYNPPVTLTRWERAAETFRRYSEADGIPAFNWPNVFKEDRAGNVWIGLHNGGLLRWRGRRLEAFGVGGHVPEGIGQSLYLDRAGRLWYAASTGGALLADPAGEDPRAGPLPTDNLASLNLRGFAEDPFGRVYFATARGVDRLDPETGRVKHFTTADGLIKSEVVAAFRDRVGRMWFGTREGVSRLTPAPDVPTEPPPVFIGRLAAGGVAQAVAELGETEVPELEFGPSGGQVQIDFFGLSFAAGDAVRFQYKFEGAGGDWSAPTDQRTVTANLSPGKYRFLVRAVGPDGAGVGRPASVSLNILPPVWQRWWFLALAALVAGSVIYRVARARARRALLLERVRTRIATDLHDDIGASLSKIAILSEVVSHRVNADANGAGSPVAEPLATIAGTSREMVDSMSDIVWAINPKRDRLSDLAQRMRLFASDLLSARDIRFTFRAPDASRDITVGADLRREVYLIFKETVNNLAKHSACEDAEIELRLAGSRLVVRVSDNGKGFDHARGVAAGGEHSTMGGHGLHSMRGRAEKLGGTYEIDSARGRGTTVTLEVPVKIRRRRRVLPRLKKLWRR
ncbi:MAG TPA: two-component regulator propeller domain-containing protein [Pyrinomonadaceae bacterium]|nr:two-component regulator propeller domain-containing protein [Pyrinomonadaceae bacterium]